MTCLTRAALFILTSHHSYARRGQNNDNKPFGAWLGSKAANLLGKVTSEFLKMAEQEITQKTVDWPYSLPPTENQQTEGPWPKAESKSLTNLLQTLTVPSMHDSNGLFTVSPMIGKATINYNGEDTEVPFPHSIQDAEGIGILGTANLTAVKAAVKKPWVPVETVDGRAVWSTWKDVERVNYMNQVCQRQWIAFYVMHKDRTFPPVEHPVQILFGQFTSSYTYYLYNYKMYTDCEKVVQIDRQLYGWDSALAEHNYTRNVKGHLDWKVTSGSKPVMDLQVHMPYGVPQLLKAIRPLVTYGTMVGKLFGKDVPDPNALEKLLTQDDWAFHWVTVPGVAEIKNSDRYTPVIWSPFNMWDTPAYPTNKPNGSHWDVDNYGKRAYYTKDGPFSAKTPLDPEDKVTWHDSELAKFDMTLEGDFTLAFYTHHFRMQWEPQLYVRVEE